MFRSTSNCGTSAVRFRRWDIDRWNGGTFGADGAQTSVKGWKDTPPLTAADDIVAGREQAPIEFMAPYPASLFKLMVAFHTLRLVDRGTLELNAEYAYDPAGGCAGAAAGTETNRAWLTGMITASDNRSACALVKQLHQLGELDAMNTQLRERRGRRCATVFGDSCSSRYDDLVGLPAPNGGRAVVLVEQRS